MCIGFTLANLLYNVMFYRCDLTNGGGNITYYILLAICVVGCGVGSYWGKIHSLVVGISSFGSFIVVRVFGIMIGYFPDELHVADEILGGKYYTMPWYFYLYFVIIIAIAAVSIHLQLKFLRRMKECSDMSATYSALNSISPSKIQIDEKIEQNFTFGNYEDIKKVPTTKFKSDLPIKSTVDKEDDVARDAHSLN